MRNWPPIIALLACVLLCTSCAMRPSELPRDEEYVLAVKDATIHAALLFWAKHSFIDYRKQGTWQRLEIPGPAEGVTLLALSDDDAYADLRKGSDVRVRTMLTGDRAKLAIEEIEALATTYPNRSIESYYYWPGPNSNTFVAWQIRNAPSLDAELDHNAIGVNHALFRIGATPPGYGLTFDTPVLGASADLREGIELHILQLEFGVALFPPAIKLPFIGRIGWQSRDWWDE